MNTWLKKLMKFDYEAFPTFPFRMSVDDKSTLNSSSDMPVNMVKTCVGSTDDESLLLIIMSSMDTNLSSVIAFLPPVGE